MTSSVTYHHLCAVINSELKNIEKKDTIRILDVGCGNGQLILFLMKSLPILNNNICFEMYGFDVNDMLIQGDAYVQKTIQLLNSEIPNVDWNTRLAVISTSETWPYADNYFDFVISNQVMEHVRDHKFVFRQMHRVLKEHGKSIHLFPLIHCVYDGHLNLPFVHWISDADLRCRYILLMSTLGMGKYKRHLRVDESLTKFIYSKQHADYIAYETNYVSLTTLYRVAKNTKFKCTFAYTEQYYLNKLRQIFGRPLKYQYARRVNFINRCIFMILVRISSVTMILEKSNTYINLNA